MARTSGRPQSDADLGYVLLLELIAIFATKQKYAPHMETTRNSGRNNKAASFADPHALQRTVYATGGRRERPTDVPRNHLDKQLAVATCYKLAASIHQLKPMALRMCKRNALSMETIPSRGGMHDLGNIVSNVCGRGMHMTLAAALSQMCQSQFNWSAVIIKSNAFLAASASSSLCFDVLPSPHTLTFLLNPPYLINTFLCNPTPYKLTSIRLCSQHYDLSLSLSLSLSVVCKAQ
jgi:hypothetical protein